MKNTLLQIVAALAACFGAPVGFRTANASDTPEDNSTLSLLCRGAGVDPIDVRWRVAAGLDVEQAVQAAIAQQASDAARAKAEKEAAKAAKKAEQEAAQAAKKDGQADAGKKEDK